MSRRIQRAEDERAQLLRLLETDPSVSQREIARQLGLSVGKVHYLLKALAEKGVIKMRSFSQNERKIGYAYYLTPRGLAEKAALTRRFLQRKIAEYDALARDIEALEQELQAVEDVKIR